MERRNFIRLLIVLGIGIPVAVEGATLLGLVGSRFGDGDDESTRDPSSTPTPTGSRVGVGDELLPATEPTDRVTDAAVYATSDRWRFELTVEVHNSLDTAYELRLGAVTTDDGATAEGGASTGPMASGETTTITGTWELPSGATPAAVTATGLVAVPGAETQREHSRQVPLERFPVQGDRG